MTKTCFVICPLGRANSESRQRSDRLLDLILRPVLKTLDYEVSRADLTLVHPMIPSSISQHIFEDDLVVADLSDSNPNVFYELGKRHAWNGPCIHFTNSIGKLPFDVKHFRVLEYNANDDAERIEYLRKELRLAVLAAEKGNPPHEFPPTADDVIRLSGKTVVVRAASGRDDPYLVSQGVASAGCKRVLLMQRSSSLILGAEQGWGAEKAFYETIMSRIQEGVPFFHVVSLDGIQRHLKRPQSAFPSTTQALRNLLNIDGLVAIEGKSQPAYIKRLPDQSDREDFKPDRQARVVLAEKGGGAYEGNFVIDIGDTQCSFHLRGSEVDHFMRRAMDFYHNDCEYLKWTDLRAILGDAMCDSALAR